MGEGGGCTEDVSEAEEPGASREFRGDLRIGAGRARKLLLSGDEVACPTGVGKREASEVGEGWAYKGVEELLSSGTPTTAM